MKTDALEAWTNSTRFVDRAMPLVAVDAFVAGLIPRSVFCPVSGCSTVIERDLVALCHSLRC